MHSLASKPDVSAITSFVCKLYGFNTSNINEARFQAFMCIRGGKKESFPKFKRINCASHPPCAESLANHIKRANFVAKMWENANRSTNCDTEAEEFEESDGAWSESSDDSDNDES